MKGKQGMRYRVWQCRVCGWIYDEKKGAPKDGIPPGTRWTDIPEDWLCPECLARKSDFRMVDITYQPALVAEPEHVAANGTVVVVGSGVAAYQFVEEYRQLSAGPVVMVTREDGAYFPKPALSVTLARKLDAEHLVHAASDAMARRLECTILSNRTVTAIDTRRSLVRLDDGEEILYQKLVLACGARPIVPVFAGDGAHRVHTVNSLVEYRKLRLALTTAKKVVVIGAGLIGCEFANDLASNGYRVTCVDMADEPLGTILPSRAAQALRNALEELGVSFCFRSTVAQILLHGEGLCVRLNDGTEIIADLILCAIGMRPETALATAAGIFVNRGIVVNRTLETSAPNIYGIGDCVEIQGRNLQFVAPAMAEARALARTLAGNTTFVDLGVCQIVVKTPALPIMVMPPPPGKPGAWCIEGDSRNVKGIYIGRDGQTLGAVLTGQFIAERDAIVGRLPAALSEDFDLDCGNFLPNAVTSSAKTPWERLYGWWLGA